MTAINHAKRLVRDWLQLNHLPFTKLTARTISFQDLARGESIFVKVHGWQPSGRLTDLKAYAKENGFCVETDGMFG